MSKKRSVTATLAILAVASSSAVAAQDVKVLDKTKFNDSSKYKVVINHEEQYGIWPVDRKNERGWKDVGKTGTKQECQAYIDKVWTDMRPLSLRKKMEDSQRDPKKN